MKIFAAGASSWVLADSDPESDGETYQSLGGASGGVGYGENAVVNNDGPFCSRYCCTLNWEQWMVGDAGLEMGKRGTSRGASEFLHAGGVDAFESGLEYSFSCLEHPSSGMK